MTFKVDRKTVTEGDVVAVEWNCTGADGVELTIDNGYKSSVLVLPIEGSKKFRLNRSKGRTRLTITATVGGKKYSKTERVRVKPMPTTHAETVDSKGRRVGAIGRWWDTAKARWSMSWRALTPEKRVAVRLMLMLAALMLLTIIMPRLMAFGLLIILGYLMWIVWKR